MTTSASRDENRLTDEDRTRMTAVVNGYLDTGGMKVLSGIRETSAQLLAVHSIGCRAVDLRDSELDEVAALVTAAVKARQ